MANHGEIVSQIRAALKVTDPDLDTSTGSVTRKIIDAVAQPIAEAYIDQHLLSYSYDVDAKTEADLDNFVQLFGLSRIPARRAIGTITVTRAGAATSLVSIPVHSQFSNAESTPAVVQTIVAAWMDVGETSVVIPVQAVEAGPDGNIPPGTLYPLSPLDSVATVVNPAALTGGSVQETDTQLRERWKRTVFRNMAGTESMFLGIALNDADCGAANVIGASKRRREQLQIASGAATSTLTQGAYTYTGNQIVGKNIDAGDIAMPGVDYTWNTGVNPPRVDVLNATALPDGTLIDVEFDYVPLASRNVPGSNITNRVDVWCAGSRAVDAAQSVVFKNTLTFNNTGGSTYLRTDWIRPDGTNPANANIFIPLAFGPIITVPTTITIGPTTYGLATAANPLGTVAGGVTYAYQIVHHNTSSGWSPQSMFGLEWNAANVPANNTVIPIDYTYNGVPHSIQYETNRWRLVGTDVRVHQAKSMYLKFNLAIIYDFNADSIVVAENIDTALSDYLSRLGIASIVQASDVLQVVHNVPGVDAVRFLHGADVVGWNPATPNNYTVGIQRVVETTVVQSYVDANGRATDVVFSDSEVPVFGLANKVIKAQNSYGVA